MTETTDPVTNSPDRRPSRPVRRSGAGKGVVEWVVIIAVALIAAFLIKTFVVQAFYIPSGSMEPTIKPGDRVLVDKVGYTVHTGDIIVFAKVADDDAGVKDLIKRVIGLPGQTLRSGPDGEVFVDGKLLKQPWLKQARADGYMAGEDPAICASPPVGLGSRTDCVGDVLHLPKNEYYVMGDHRDDSDDSRFWGPVAKKLIVGTAFVRIWPLSRLHWF